MDREMRVTPPDLITVLNASLGFFSITYIIDGRFWIASVLIIICISLDGLDGALARYMDVEHELGGHLDFFADIISFCFAPALLLYTTYYDETLGRGWESPQNALATLIPFLIVFLGTFRLVRFADKRSKEKTYSGLPAPALALLVIHITYYLGWGGTGLFLPHHALLSIGVLSILLYAPINYPKIREKKFLVGGSMFLIVILVALLLTRFSKEIGSPILLVTVSILLGYVFISPVIVKYHRRNGW